MHRLSVALVIVVGCGGNDGSGTDEPPIISETPDAAAGDPPPEPDAAPPSSIDAGIPAMPGTLSCTSNGEMQLGTGVREFEPVTDGATVYLYQGPQGGYMVYLSVRARGFDPELVYLQYTVHFQGGDQIGEGQWQIKLPNDLGDGWRERVGVWGQLDRRFWTSPQLVKGHDITVAVKLGDKHGVCASASYDAHVSTERGM